MEKALFISNLAQNFERISLFFGAGLPTNIQIPLATQFTFSRETFNGTEFEAKLKKLQIDQSEQTVMEFFSTVSNQSVLSYKIFAHLALHDEPEQELMRLKTNEQALLEVGFKNSTYQKIAALFLEDVAHAKRAKQLHNEMKKQHHFLTGKDDIPYAVLLTRQQENASDLAKTMRQYYDFLTKKGFKSGDALQAMTQLLTLYSAQYGQVLVDYVVAVKDEFTKRDLKVKKKLYPYIALLALAGATTETINEIDELQKELHQLKMFSIEPQYALMTAVQFVLHDMIENEKLNDFKDSILFMQALDISSFLGDIKLWVALEILDLFL
jgi:hypothetical protein